MKRSRRTCSSFVEYGDGDGVDDDDFSDDFSYALYRGISVDSKGVELEVAGHITEDVKMQAGYTYLKMEDKDGEDARTFIPRNTLKPAVDLGIRTGRKT